MSEELKAMLEGLTTDELRDVQTTIADLLAIAEESKDEDGQPDEMKEQSDFAKDDTIPYEEDDRPF